MQSGQQEKSEKNNDILQDDSINKTNHLEKIGHSMSIFFRKLKFLKRILIVFVVFGILGQANFSFLEDRSMWQDKLAGTNIKGSFAKDTLASELQDTFENYLRKKTIIKVKNNIYAFSNKSLGINFNLEKTHEKFFQGNNAKISYFEKYLSRLNKVYAGETYLADTYINKNTLEKTLFTLIPELENKAIDSKIIINNNTFEIIPSETGVTFDIDKIAEQLNNNAKSFEITEIKLDITKDIPKISEQDTKLILEEYEKIKNKKIILKSENPVIYKALDLKNDLSIFRISKFYNPLNSKTELYFDFDPLKLKEYIEKEIAPNINRDSKDIYLTINDNLEIKTSGEIQDGRMVNIEKNIELIQDALKEDSSKKEVKIAIDDIAGKIIQPEKVDTGIHELIAYGESNFGGSPANRRHNITVAMKNFQNIIVMPEEIFSFNKYLGQVDQKTGYKKELVIKEGGNLTIPEYGGGVCQVSTTLFRAALYGGFEITERHNHSYKVSYYNPDGLDASVYPPRTDFRFKNNTGYPILIQNELDLKSSKAYFRIYGTKNYKQVTLDGPHLYEYKNKPAGVITNYVPSQPQTFYQEKKGHKGFKVYWTRQITALDDIVKEDKFYSSYKPISDTINIGGTKPTP